MRVNYLKFMGWGRYGIYRISSTAHSHWMHLREANGFLTVLYSGEKAESLALAEELGRLVQQSNVPVVHMPPAIATHGGSGILGVSFFNVVES